KPTAVPNCVENSGRRKIGFAASVQDEATFATVEALPFNRVETAPFATLVVVRVGIEAAIACEKSSTPPTPVSAMVGVKIAVLMARFLPEPMLLYRTKPV